MPKPGDQSCSVRCNPGLFETVKKTIPLGATDSMTKSSIDMVMRNETNKVTTRLGFASGLCVGDLLPYRTLCATVDTACNFGKELMSATVRIRWRMRSFPRRFHSHDALLALSESQLRFARLLKNVNAAGTNRAMTTLTVC